MKHGGLLNKHFCKKKSNNPNETAEIDGCQVGWKIHMENPYGFFFPKILFFLICFNTYEL